MNSPMIHKKLQSLAAETKSLPPKLAISEIYSSVDEIHNAINEINSIALKILFIHYLSFWGKRYADESLSEKAHIAILDIISIDPSQFSAILAQSFHYRLRNQNGHSAHLLKRIAASGYRESRIAKQLIGDEVRKKYLGLY